MTEGRRHTSRFDEALDDSVVRVSTPNEQVFGEVRGEREVRVTLAHGHYEQVSIGKLQEELVSVARLLFAAARKEHDRLFGQVTGRTLQRERPTGRRAEYVERLHQLGASGVSDDGAVTVTAVGQQNYSVQIAPGTLETVSREQFEADCAQAANRLLVDTEQQAARLKWDFFEPIPGLKL